MKYKTLKELVAAVDRSEMTDGILWLDNDSTDLFVDGERLFHAHPATLLEQALDLLGITWEHV